VLAIVVAAQFMFGVDAFIAGSGSGMYGTTAQIANAAGVAAIGAVFFAMEAAYSARLALFAASALFTLSMVASAVFLSWMRRASA
jgi:hypothetical protein